MWMSLVAFFIFALRLVSNNNNNNNNNEIVGGELDALLSSV